MYMYMYMYIYDIKTGLLSVLQSITFLEPGRSFFVYNSEIKEPSYSFSMPTHSAHFLGAK